MLQEELKRTDLFALCRGYCPTAGMLDELRKELPGLSVISLLPNPNEADDHALLMLDADREQLANDCFGYAEHTLGLSGANL